MAHTFLSDDWLAAAKAIADEAGTTGAPDIQLNVLVTGGPDGDKELNMSKDGFGAGFMDGAPTKLILPYDLAKKMFVDGDQAAGMQAFMSGQIKVEGDMSKLMAMQGGGGPDASLQAKLKEITA